MFINNRCLELDNILGSRFLELGWNARNVVYVVVNKENSVDNLCFSTCFLGCKHTSFIPSIFFVNRMSRGMVVGSCFWPVAWPRLNFSSRYLFWVSLNRVALLVVVKAQPSGNVLALSDTVSLPALRSKIITQNH